MTKFLTQRELEAALEEVVKDIENETHDVQAINIPPDVDEQTDEENIDDDNLNQQLLENVDIWTNKLTKKILMMTT
ncbi:hypothetical protein QE152_g25316 [Popillia japonica]|uniref:Uncharacterized protein n=1 Tax=Popillia japonica TaxID=7064 RepID=A0AAW1K364_POPJA